MLDILEHGSQDLIPTVCFGIVHVMITYLDFGFN